MTVEVTIRQEAPADAAAVHAVVADAFGDPSVADLVDALRTSADWIAGLSFVAVEGADGDTPEDAAHRDGGTPGDRRAGHRDGDAIIGHVLFTRSRLDTPTRLIDVLQLSPLSVSPHRQGRGIGSALVRRGLEALSGRTEPLVFLEGSPGYYSRFGFVAGGPLGFRRPSLRIPPAAFQVIPLGAYRPWMTGTLIYSDVFWQHDAVGLRDEQGTTWPD